MQCTRKLTEMIYWVGGSDRRSTMFENRFPITQGMAYNSYLITDEKTALMDTVDASISQLFMENVEHVLKGRDLDYLIVNHMEPDHCAGIEALLLRYPNMRIVGNSRTIQFLKQFYARHRLDERIFLVEDGQELSLGSHILRFALAPMVHWPEAMVVYEKSERLLFSADAFGAFGSLGGNLFDDELNIEKDWMDETRRYYANIVGKFGAQVKALLDKLSGFEIRMICPLHGPVWRTHVDLILHKYDLWSRYVPEEQAVMVAYGSMYGNTENAAVALASMLAEKGMRNIRIYDVSRTDPSYLIGEMFRCSHMILAAPTYTGELFPEMETLLLDIKSINLQNRTVALIQNGTWGPVAARKMKAILEGMKEITILEPELTLKSTLREDQTAELEKLRDLLLN